MKSYWDSSALIKATGDSGLRLRLKSEKGFTRTHALSEVFSSLTGGNLALRTSADFALDMLRDLAADLEFIELTPLQVLEGLGSARRKGVRGGRVHDYIHMLVAEKSGAPVLITSDRNDFNELSTIVKVEQV